MMTVKYSETNKEVLVNDINNNDEKLKKLEWTWSDVVWWRVILWTVQHVQLPYAIYLFLYDSNSYTFWWTYFVHFCGGMGITAGCHRLWTHRAYKANIPYQTLLMLFATSCFQGDIISWCKIHRMHHKYAETDADPHNAKRGFFYSHVGWLFIKPHPEVTEKEKYVDVRDLENDHLLQFQRKYFTVLTLFCFVLVPTIVPYFVWGESLWIAFNLAVLFRYTFQLHTAFAVNSFAHMFGTKPFDKQTAGYENQSVNFITAGEGWHNYHHTFPHDYRASELPWNYNVTTRFIDFFALFGWVYDRKTVSTESIAKKKLKMNID